MEIFARWHFTPLSYSPIGNARGGKGIVSSRFLNVTRAFKAF
jgi:hypothetical protein